MASKARNELNLEQKVKLINASFSGRSQRQLAADFGCGKTQVSCILKRKAEYLDAYENNMDGSRKRALVHTQLDEVNTVTWQWFQRARSSNIPVSGPMVKEKALQFASQLGEADFKASNGWLDSFRRRHNIVFNAVCGESASVCSETVDTWKQRLPSITQDYAPRDIYNMDETGVFFRTLPDKTLTVRGEDCKGGKHSKERLTVVLCGNMVGELDKPLVIGKSANPRCFRNISPSSLPVTWRYNRKAWMTSALFTEWIMDFNHRMRIQNRHVLLFVDNAPSHPSSLTLSNIKLQFFPPNTTSVLQPMDQGIIQAFKVVYRKRLLRAALAKVDQGYSCASDVTKAINVLDACYWIAGALRDVKQETVARCFARCGFPVSAPPEPVSSDQGEGDQLISATTSKLGLTSPMSSEDFFSLDDTLPVCEGVSDNWDSQLLEDLAQERQEEPQSDEEEEIIQETKRPRITSLAQALAQVEDLKDFFVERGVCPLVDLFMHAEEAMQRHAVATHSGARQSTLDSFFTRR